MRRELRLVADDSVIGWVDDSQRPPFDPVAANVLSLPIAELGEVEAARRALAYGWSNGYLRLAEPTP